MKGYYDVVVRSIKFTRLDIETFRTISLEVREKTLREIRLCEPGLYTA
jgi:hypothetical protein